MDSRESVGRTVTTTDRDGLVGRENITAVTAVYHSSVGRAAIDCVESPRKRIAPADHVENE